jgi:autotransporter-associated beta strand protein
LALVLFVFASRTASGQTSCVLTAKADTYIQRNAPIANNGSATTVLAKRESATGSGSYDRIGYFRFLTPTSFGEPDDVSLSLTVTDNAGYGGTLFGFTVYGLPDGHANEAFDEAALNFNTAVNASTSASGSFSTNGTVLLGTVTAVSLTEPQVLTLRSAALRDFVAANGNTNVSFAVVRSSANTSVYTAFASSEDAAASQRPLLAARTALPVAAVAASSVLDTSAASQATNAVDRSAETRWTAAADTGSTKSWFRLDFGSTQTVNRCTFTAFMHGRSYMLEVSANGTLWSAVASNVLSGVGSGTNTEKLATTRFFQPRPARYLRLTSQTSLSGNSLSLWEVQAYNDTVAQPRLSRLATNAAAVAGLSDTSADGLIKRAVLDVALERAQAGLNAFDDRAADLMLDDVESRLATPASQMAAPAAGLTNISILRTLAVTTTNANPYLRRLTAGASLALASAERVWDKNTADLNWLEDFNLARSQSGEMESYLWVFAHPDSPLKGHPELLRRLLRRALNYLDVINTHTDSLGVGQLNGIYDDFALAPASMALSEFQRLYPSLLPPNLSAEWDAGMARAGNKEYEAYQSRTANWVNTDVAIAVALFNFGTKLGNQAMLDKAKYFVDDVLTSGRLFADGAVGYINTQNEAGGYQSTVATYVRRYYEVTGYAPALTILKGMEWYGPLNGRMIDWWTSPSWKQAWNFISGSGQTGESTNGQNPFTRDELDASIGAAATASNWIGKQGDVSWYQGPVAALSRGDYTVFDRNIVGPRAWYGRWNYTATLRDIADTDSGHSTVMGCQTMDPDPNFRVNASVMGVFPRIRVSPNPSRSAADGSFVEENHAWLTSGLAGDSTVSRDFSAVGVSYKIHAFGSSTKGTEYNWTARQMWLGLPDRIIGYADLGPNASTTAYELQGAIRLGYGGTAYSAHKTLASLGGDRWSYGDLLVTLHGHGFAEVTNEVYAFRTVPFTEITLRDQVGGATNTVAKSYTTASRRGFLAEIRPSYAAGDAAVTEQAAAGGLLGFDVSIPTNGRLYRVVYNPGSAAANYTFTNTWSAPVRAHRSGERYRPDWVPEATGPLPSLYLAASVSTLSIPAYGHVVLERSPAVVKANNTEALNRSASWTGGAQADGAIARWDATVTGDNATSVGTGVNFAGLEIAAPGGNVTISPGSSGVLALGSAGINVSNSVRALTLSAPVRFEADQTWVTGVSGAADSSQITVTGPVSGAGTLSVYSPGGRAVELGGDNTFTGGVTVKSGSLRITRSGALGLGPKTVSVNSSTSSSLKLDGRSGNITVPSNITFNVSNPNGTLVNEAGTNTLAGAITLTVGAGGSRFTAAAGLLTLQGRIAPNNTGRTLDLRGAGAGLISGAIADGAGASTLAALTKNESGTWTLNGTNTYTGPTTINAGTFAVNGSLASVVTVSGGTLCGSGVLSSNVTINGGVHAPGSSVGAMTVGGAYALSAGGTLQIEINGPAPGTQADQLRLTNPSASATLAGSLSVIAASGLPAGTSCVILSRAGAAPVSGTFLDKPQNAVFPASGYWWRISYNGGDGNDIALTLVAPYKARLLAPSPLADGRVRLGVDGDSNLIYAVQASTNLVYWSTLFVTNPPALPFNWTDPDALLYRSRFYRVLLDD